MTDQSIQTLVALVKLNPDEETTREAARELHRRGVSVVGIIPTRHGPVEVELARQRRTQVDRLTYA